MSLTRLIISAQAFCAYKTNSMSGISRKVCTSKFCKILFNENFIQRLSCGQPSTFVVGQNNPNSELGHNTNLLTITHTPTDFRLTWTRIIFVPTQMRLLLYATHNTFINHAFNWASLSSKHLTHSLWEWEREHQPPLEERIQLKRTSVFVLIQRQAHFCSDAYKVFVFTWRRLAVRKGGVCTTVHSIVALEKLILGN